MIGHTFQCIEITDTYLLVYHVKTRVMYAVSNGQSSRGVFTLLVNADGTPMLYDEAKNSD